MELLAAVCRIEGGHQIVLDAFDNFKVLNQEKTRFETLMSYFKNHFNEIGDSFNIDFIVIKVSISF